MPQQTVAQARVIDPILSSVARGYRSPLAPVADLLFPIVPVGARGGTILSFGVEAYKLYNTARAPGANIKRVQFGYASGTYALGDFDLEGMVPVEIQEEAMAVPGIDHGSLAVMGVQDLMAREREYQAATLALAAGSYAGTNKVTLSGTDQWSDPASTPINDVAEAREAVRKKVGRRPDVMVIGPAVRAALEVNPQILARLRGGTGADATTKPVPSLADLSQILQLRVVEGDMTYHNGTDFVDIWGKFALLAFTEPGGVRDMGRPNFGYTYQLQGRPAVAAPYYSNSNKSWIYPVADARAPYLVGADAGYLISAAVA